jgi:acetyl-CoA carboxylase biotin carboxyl carrier protein
MDVSLLERMVKLMAVNDLNTIDVRDGQQRVILKRGAVQPLMPSVSYAPPAAATPAAAPAGAGASAAGGEASGADEMAGLIPIKSPMVGTFYQAPAKGAKPFVTVGSVVDEDTDVCIVEAMKVFNNIKAETRGTIAKILVQDSQPVEFGQTLFLVKLS